MPHVHRSSRKTDSVIGCLEVMASVSKVIPKCGGIAEVRLSWSFPCLLLFFSEQCMALSEHAALITCAIVNGVAASRTESIGDLLLYVLCFIYRFVSETYSFSKRSAKCGRPEPATIPFNIWPSTLMMTCSQSHRATPGRCYL